MEINVSSDDAVISVKAGDTVVFIYDDDPVSVLDIGSVEAVFSDSVEGLEG